ncbi:MAG: M20/M25/M40 family metallo-hydrolase [Acidobacteria bacterium]|nr:M20/M25/M40 family metallo-hydrolase [Acidobacteriota bacterium]
MIFVCIMWMLGDDGVLKAPAMSRLELLQQQALHHNRAFDILESLTVEVGPRMAGTSHDLRGVQWAKHKFEELGFDEVWLEQAQYPSWIRGEATCEIVDPFPQPLAVTALGTSVATLDDGVTAQVVSFENLDALKSADPLEVSGKIVFINQAMERSNTGRGYGKAVVVRRSGASEAARKGALAVLIRSIGTDSHRFPHTGLQRYDEDTEQIPAAALSNPDANQLQLALKRGPVTLRLFLSARKGPMFSSFNVIGEIKGREVPEELVLLGAHLDSWDLGTGALDDGAGVAIVTEVGRLISNMRERPRRTIRVVLFANEEQGLWGAKAYAAQHESELNRHMIAAESDFGAGPVWHFTTAVREKALPFMHQVAEALKPLGVDMGDNNSYGGPDLRPMMELGLPVVSLIQDGTDYFDYHHTADDTLDKVDPKALSQSVAAFATFAYMCAETDVTFSDEHIHE